MSHVSHRKTQIFILFLPWWKSRYGFVYLRVFVIRVCDWVNDGFFFSLVNVRHSHFLYWLLISHNYLFFFLQSSLRIYKLNIFITMLALAKE